jgi:2,4-dienoyl-CoA reductase (NADPH2)
VAHTNHRRDRWGGDYSHRMRLPVEVVRRVREAVGPNFIVIYRISLVDLIPDGSNWPEVLQLARAVTAAGASILNTGIGWHEARVPTIATSVPRAAFAWVTKKLRTALRAEGQLIPVVTGNRLNTPDVAEAVLADGSADLVSLARPFLADPDFVAKAQAGRVAEINTCIACNQACLDHAFQNRIASCLVNPRACHETELVIRSAPAQQSQRQTVAVVGAGPAGLAAACTLAERGFKVHLFDSAQHIGGQFNMAKTIPGKEEFEETLRYFRQRLQRLGVQQHLGQRVSAESLVAGAYAQVLLATGVRPRNPRIPGQDHPAVLSYIDVLLHKQPVGRRVGIMGAGGIGFDVAEYLAHGADQGHPSTTTNLANWLREWGVADPEQHRGGVVQPQPAPPVREVTLLQRKPGKHGASLGKTTGWIHRAALKLKDVQLVAGVNYERIAGNEAGGVSLFISHGPKHQNGEMLEFDTLVLCAGQEPLRELHAPLLAAGVSVHLVGGAFEAAELDAKRAIDQGTRLAARL